MSKNLKNIDWEKYDDFDEFYDDLILEEKSRKMKVKNKVHDEPSHNKKANKRDGVDKKAVIESEMDNIIVAPVTMAATPSPAANPAPRKKQVQTPPVVKQPVPSPQPQTVKTPPAQPKQFVFGENTHEIKSVKIDFDKVVNMELVEGDYNGHQTFGIKFYFAGSKGLFRIIWFSRNLFERDRVFAIEYKFWKSIQQGEKKE